MKTLLSILSLVCACAVFTVHSASAQSSPSTTPFQQPEQAPQTLQTPQNPENRAEDGVEALFGENMRFTLVPSLRLNPAENALGSTWGVYGGVNLNPNFLVGIGTYATLSNPTMRMGYTGLILEYVHTPNKLIHFGANALIGYGRASFGGTGLDPFYVIGNVWNVFSGQYMVIEPSVFAETNLNQSLSASLGVTYRWITGYQENRAITNQSLSGVSINLGLRFRNL
jgi:hypothetical protein